MKEKWELFKMSLAETKTMTKKEWLLTIAVFALSGIVLGMLISPRKNTTIGSNNGSNNNVNSAEDDCEECECIGCCEVDAEEE